MNDINDSRHADSVLEAHIILLRAQEALLHDDYDGAESILSSIERSTASEQVLDLLARIAVHRGRLGDAKRLWSVVLEKNPSSLSAQAALARLNSPWIAIGVMKRMAFLLCVVLVICALAAGLWSSTRWLHSAPDLSIETYEQPIRLESTQVSTAPIDIPATHAPATSVTDQQNVQPPTAAAISLPPVAGFTVHSGPGFARLVPTDPLFTYRCDFTPLAWEHLGRLAPTLAEMSTNVLIIIEGHTDDMPMPPSSPYADNYELGLYRAFAVGQVLRGNANFYPGCIMIASAGDRAPLYAGDDPDSKSRNRTAVIRLVPRVIDFDTEESVTNELAN